MPAEKQRLLFFHLGSVKVNAAFTTPALLVALLASLAAPAQAAVHTVCASGCDFVSPAACAIGDDDNDGMGDSLKISNGDTCLVQGGVYHETVSYQTSPFIGRTNLIIQCAAGEHCVLDGEAWRENAVKGYYGWVIDGFEIRNYQGSAITAYQSNAAVRNCWIHDVEGNGIDDMGEASVVENNRVEFVGSMGILCASSKNNQLIKNNIVFNSRSNAISCNRNGAKVQHNTVVLSDVTTPYGDPAASGILARVAQYNIVVGGNTGIMTSGTGADSSYNLAFGAGSTNNFSDGGSSAGNIEADPLFVGLGDFYLQANSPAIEAALTSTETTDFSGTTRSGTADMGALEYDAAHTDDRSLWPVAAEVVASLSHYDAAPSIAWLDAQGPVLSYFDVENGNTIEFAERLSDKSWRSESIASANMPDYNVGDYYQHSTDMAINPENNYPGVAWVDDTGSARTVHFAEMLAEPCGTDCSSARWAGCSDTVVSKSSSAMSVSLAYHPTEHYPAMAVVNLSSTGYYTLYYYDKSGGDWAGIAVDGNLAGPDAALAFNPETYQAELAYLRIASTENEGDVIYNSGSLSGFGSGLSIPVNTEWPAADGAYSQVAMAHKSNGDVVIAYSTRNQSKDLRGYAVVESSGGGWSMSWANPQNKLVISKAGYAQVRFNGLSLKVDSADHPVLAAALDDTVHLARQDDLGSWFPYAPDLRKETGYWIDLALDPQDHALLAYQRHTVNHDVQFAADAEIGGADPASQPVSCDDADPCTVDACDGNTMSCTHLSLDCEDNNPCTADSCDSVNGCVHNPLPEGTRCDDGDACNGVEVCNASGQCQPGPAPAPCPDGTTGDCGTCTDCPAGSYSLGPNAATCTPCVAGTYAPWSGANSCLACPAGTYNDQEGQYSCTACAVDTYNNQSGQTFCLACPDGSTSPEGSTDISNCVVVQGPPSAPRNLTVTDRSDRSLTLSWDTPADDGGSNIERYYVTYHLSAASASTTHITANNNIILDGLTANTAYSIEVRAENSAYRGAAASLTDVYTRTAGPTILSFVASDPDNDDEVYSAADVVTLTFDMETNQPAVASKSDIDALLNFSSPLAQNYSGQWLDPATLQITIVTPVQTPTLPPVIGELTSTVKASGNLRNATEDSAASDAVSPVLTGNWGQFCSSAAPVVNSAQISDDALAIVLQLSADAWFDSDSIDCGDLLAASSLALLGQNPVCSLSASDQVRVVLGAGASVIPGDYFDIIDAALRACNHGPTSSEQRVQIQAPANPAQPELTLVNPPNELAPCPDTELTLQSSVVTGDFARPMQYTWSIAGESSEQVQQAVAAASQSSLHFPAKWLSPGTYTFAVVATNWLGQSSDRETHSLAVSADAIYELSISPNHIDTFKRSEPLHLQASLLPGSCDLPAQTEFYWSVDNDSVNLINRDGANLDLPAFTLPYGDLLFTLGVRRQGEESWPVNGSARVTVVPQELVAEIEGAQVREMQLGEDLQLDARPSHDPDQIEDFEEQFSWDCSHDDQSCPLDLASTPTILIPADDLDSGDWTFSLTYSKGDRSSQTTLQLSVLANNNTQASDAGAEDPERPSCSALSAGPSVLMLLLLAGLAWRRRYSA